MTGAAGYNWGTMRTIMIFAIAAIALPQPCQAVNFYDGARASKGLYFLTYTSLYHADETTDSSARTSISDYDYTRTEELVRFCYYTPKAVLTALLPFGRVRSGYYDTSSSGTGDVNLGAGFFLPLKTLDILPMLFVKLPAGEYDSAKSVNYGTNQYDIKPTVFFYKQVENLSIDAAAKYHFRTENRSTDISPGNELYLQCLLGWQVGKIFKLGPSLNWMRSSCQKNNGAKVPDSRRESLSAGADIYLRLKPASITLTYLRDVRTKNTTKGNFFQLKTCYKF